MPAGSFAKYRAMAESAAALERAYAAVVAKILARVQQYAATHLLVPVLAKARPPYRPLVTPAALHAIRQIAIDYHAAFIAAHVGPGQVSPAEIKRLIDIGILPRDLSAAFEGSAEEAASAIAEAYNYGVRLGRAPYRHEVAAMTLPQLQASQLPRLSAQEVAARRWAEQHAANVIVGLGNRVADDMTSTIIEADAELGDRYRQDIRGELDLNLAAQESWRKLASELGHKSKDWARDFGRIAATEKQAALQEGLSSSLIEREGDPKGIWVAKIPTPSACETCRKLHLQDGVPRIFALAELIAHGSNVGRKQAQWRAIIGPTHPWCECTLVHVPNGFHFDDAGNLVPESMRRSALLALDLQKAGGNLSYGKVVPERGVVIAIQDPVKRLICEAVCAQTPPEIFDRRVGITFITHDQPRVDNPMHDHDLAYWTGNEIRIATTLPADKLAEVLRHELGHSLNVWLMYRWGGIPKVVAWHRRLYRVSRDEGFCTAYAATNPIENAAELTRLYLYHRRRIMTEFPRAFSLLDAAYREIWRPREAGDPTARPQSLQALSQALPGEAARQAQDRRDRKLRGGAKL